MLEVELIAEYLIENSYVSSERDAYEFIPHMSDGWLSLVLEEVLNEETYSLYDVISEMRKEDKVKGKKKTPSHIEFEGKSKMEKTPEGRWVKKTPIHRISNPDMLPGRYRQGMPQDPEKAHPKYRDYLIDKSLRRQPHGGAETGVPAGYARGVKKQRGVPLRQPETFVAKLKQAKADAEAKKASRAAQSNRYGNRG